MSATNYSRINWKDYPDTSTPTTAENLNKLDKGIYDLDQYITGLDVSAPSASGNAIAFIDSVSQADGKISATKKTVSTVSTSGAGLAPKVTDTSKYLKGDGTWATPTNTTYGVVSTSANGLAPKVTDTSKYLKGDGTWATPTNTTYGVVSTSANGLAPKVTDTSKYLKGDGTWSTPTNTNNAVTQTATSTSANYEVLFSSTADNTTRTEGARKNSNLLFNPSTGNLQATQLNGVTIGSSPKFTDTNTWRGIQNNLTSTSTTDSLSAYQGKVLNDAIASINSNLSAKQYFVRGSIANGTGTTFSGIGFATVLLLKGGVAIIYYEYTITALNKTGVFTYGLNKDILRALNSNIPNIKPIAGGICHILAKYNNFPNANNTILRPILGDAFGYAQTHSVNGQFWQPGRVYDASGSYGGWPESIGFNVNDSIYGIAFGTY